MRTAKVISAAFVVAAGIGAAQAQSTAASGSVIVVPVVAQTTSYTSEVTVQNPNASPIIVNVTLHQGHDPAGANPGSIVCSPVVVAAGASVPFSLPDQCPGLATGNHFGMLVLSDAAVQQTNVFFAYSRTQTPGGNGFSVEGFPIGAFSGAVATVAGLKRQAAAPTYQTNCFVGALSEGANYQVALHDGAGNVIGATSGALQPFEMIRLFDVFEAAGVTPGDRSNVSAEFSQDSSDFPALVGFCTVQESTFFGADFRIAKSIDALNEGQKRVACIGMDDCGAPGASVKQPEEITNAGLKNVYSMIITQPDFVSCNLVSSRLSEMQMQLRAPGDPFASATVAGGVDQTSFYASTGARSAVDHGTATRWFIDVSARTGATGTFDFGIVCRSGNGTEIPWFRGTAAMDF